MARLDEHKGPIAVRLLGKIVGFLGRPEIETETKDGNLTVKATLRWYEAVGETEEQGLDDPLREYVQNYLRETVTEEDKRRTDESS